MRIREPFNAASHLLGLLLAATGSLMLLQMSRAGAELVAFSVYGSTLVLLYAVSTLYHSLPLPPPQLRPLRMLDHIAIYFLIAGTYTPLALLTLRGRLGWALLVAVWGVAAAGIPFKVKFLEAPVWISTLTYLGMGYLAVGVLPALSRVVSPSGLAWLVGGGVAYTVGAVVYARERPDPLPGVFGYHGLWHVLVLVGSGCHFAFMVFHVLQA
jgi:hemolysin III